MMGQATSLLSKQIPPVVKSWFAVFEASAQSRAGEGSKAMAALGRAEKAIGKDQEPWAWPVPLDARTLTAARGFCATDLKLPTVSIPALHEGVSQVELTPSKWRALVLSYLAENYILTKEIEEACGLAGEAFDVGVQLQSDRVLKRIAGIRRELAPWKETRAVRELEERMVSGLL
jgi:hypothetical protein